MLSCDQILSELGNLLDDDVTREVRRELEAHLAHCRTCTVILDSSRKTVRLVTDAGSFELPDRVSERVLQRIRSQAAAGPGSAPPPPPAE